MAQGHINVVRRALNGPEWIRVRLAEIAHWAEFASAPINQGWEVRQARYNAPGDYTFLENWRPISEGDLWGAPDGTFFLRNTIRIPTLFKNLPVSFNLLTPTEMLFSIKGKIANGVDPNRSEVPLFKRSKGNEVLPVQIEAYMRSAPDDGRIAQRIGEGLGCVQTWRSPRLVSYDPVYRKAMLDIQFVWDVASANRAPAELAQFLYHHLDAAARLIDRETRDRKTFHRSLAAACAYLQKNVYAAKDRPGQGALALVGHSHLDIAYHWRIRQGVRKNARTTVAQLRLMDEYPDFLYTGSQPYFYESLKKHYPDIYRQVKAKVRAGQWELVGGMYVEPDCNVPSGESLVRQCLLGKLFFLKEFGIDVDTCWLPDVFGNAWIMPQIMVRSGIHYFVSNKMPSWNDTNPFPYSTFRWKGPDGSVMNGYIPSSHFICWLSPEQMLGNWENFKNKTTVGESIMMYGFGDGGGGATREMLEYARRSNKGFPGLPRTRQVTARQHLHEVFADPSKLATWDDELYLEAHRGTPTTRGELKRLNRRCELTAREAEIFATLAQPLGLTVPRQQLTDAWKTVLVNQFHDILPGSHTNAAGIEAEKTYGEALASFESVKSKALHTLAAHIDTASRDGLPIIVFNSLSWPQTNLVNVPLESLGENGTPKKPRSLPGSVLDSSGRELPCQITQKSGKPHLLFVAPDVPSVGYEVFHAQTQRVAWQNNLSATPRSLENEFFRIQLNAAGEITRLLDKRHNRQVIADGQRGNQLQLFEDKPGFFDAWDIIPTYKQKSWPLPLPRKITVLEQGPVRAGIRIERDFFGSSLVQTIYIYHGIPRIDFVTSVDWKERNKLLKVCFPVDILSRRATYDLSFAHISRPTHTNTSWDRAKFEVCGHQWTDLSETDYGVSLLNDSKYGHDIQGNQMRISLLRGTIRPDPDSDLGHHEFTYSLFPHASTPQEAGTIEAAHALNSPLTALPVRRHSAALPPRHSFVSFTGQAYLSALKPAESGDETVLRVVELHGAHQHLAVHLDYSISKVHECDLIERPEQRLPANQRGFATALTPFQIRTFLLK